MGRPMCENAYRQRREISLRCRKQTGATNYCCYQYYCPQTGQYENAEERRSCSLRGKKNEDAIVDLRGMENDGKNEREVAGGGENVHAADEKDGDRRQVRRKVSGRGKDHDGGEIRR